MAQEIKHRFIHSVPELDLAPHEGVCLFPVAALSGATASGTTTTFFVI
jgi:hypothetical protein